MIDASLVSAQARKRCYWTNIPNVKQPTDKGILLQDIIESGIVDRNKSLCIARRYAGYQGSQSYLRRRYFGKSMGQAVFENTTPEIQKQHWKLDDRKEWKGIGKIRPLTIVEVERLFTLPEGYISNLGISEKVAKENGLHFIKSLIWNKGNKIMGQYYMSQFEYILFFRKGAGIKINNCGTSDILNVPNVKTKDSDGNNIHDTEKPVELIKILIENLSQSNETVLDPFMGYGSTPMACVESGRNYIGIELDSKYYNLVEERINTYNINNSTK